MLAHLKRRKKIDNSSQSLCVQMFLKYFFCSDPPQIFVALFDNIQLLFPMILFKHGGWISTDPRINSAKNGAAFNLSVNMT